MFKENEDKRILFFNSPVGGEIQEKDMKHKKYDDFTIYYSPSVKNAYRVKTDFCTEDDKRIRKQKTLRVSSLRDAKTAATAWVSELKNACSLKIQNDFTTFRECIHFYLNRKKPTTNKSYFNSLNENIGNIPIDKVNGAFHDFLAFLESKATPQGKPYSNGTKNRYISYAKSILNYAVECDRISENPLKVSKFTEVPREIECADEDIERLLKVCKKHAPHIYPVVKYASIIPSRISLLVNMRVNWVQGKKIIIPAQFTKHGKSDDVKPVPPQMLDYFANLPTDSDYVFYRRLKKKGCYPLGDFKKSWYKCVKLAGLEGFRFHDLRHYSATRLLNLGISERRVMSVGNWKTNMFNTYYNRDSRSASEEVFDALQYE